MKIFYSVLIILLTFGTLFPANKAATLSQLMRPDMIAFGNNRLYVTEKHTVYVYSMKDFSFINSFGKEGEGPREFKIAPFGPPMIAIPYDDKLYVSSMAKLSIFTKDGKFIKEIKVMPFSVILPFKDKYVATATSENEKKESVLSVNLFNEKMEKEKLLYLSDMKVGPSFSFEFPLNSFSFPPYKDRIYLVAGKEGFAIDVFDYTGKKLFRINKNEPTLKVPEEYKKSVLNWFQKDPNYRQAWEFMKDRISFRTHYPAIRDILPKDDRIYVLTYKKQKGNSECIVMDLQGKEEKRVYLPCPDNKGMDYYPKYDIFNRKFYHLKENFDDETWELYVTDID